VFIDGGEVVSLRHRPPFDPQEDSSQMQLAIPCCRTQAISFIAVAFDTFHNYFVNALMTGAVTGRDAVISCPVSVQDGVKISK
jgi:hypothetical protein